MALLSLFVALLAVAVWAAWSLRAQSRRLSPLLSGPDENLEAAWKAGKRAVTTATALAAALIGAALLGEYGSEDWRRTSIGRAALMALFSIAAVSCGWVWLSSVRLQWSAHWTFGGMIRRLFNFFVSAGIAGLAGYWLWR